MDIDGTKIEFESNSADDIVKMTSAVLRTLRGSATPVTPTAETHSKRLGRPNSTLTEEQRREKKRLASLKWYYQHKDYYKKRREKKAAVATPARQVRHRATYLEWTEADIVRVAALVSLGGSNVKDINDKVYQMLRNEGDVKNRALNNLYSYTQRIYRYIHLGNQKGIAQNHIKVLTKNGFHRGMKSEQAPFTSGRLIPVEA
jgi:hypothetical protein